MVIRRSDSEIALSLLGELLVNTSQPSPINSDHKTDSKTQGTSSTESSGILAFTFERRSYQDIGSKSADRQVAGRDKKRLVLVQSKVSTTNRSEHFEGRNFGGFDSIKYFTFRDEQLDC